MNERRMNEAESLALITSMINDSRARMTENLGTPFLIWGYVVVSVTVVQAVIAATLDNFVSYMWLWFAIPVIGWLLMLLLNRNGRGAVNYIDRCVNALWCAIGVAALFIPLLCGFGSGLFPVIVLLMGVGTATTAAVVRHRTVKWIGFSAIFSSLLFPLSRFLLERVMLLEQFTARKLYLTECVIFAVLIFLLLVVSGHILNYKKRCLKS